MTSGPLDHDVARNGGPALVGALTASSDPRRHYISSRRRRDFRTGGVRIIFRRMKSVAARLRHCMSSRFLPGLIVVALFGAFTSAVRAEGAGHDGDASSIVGSQTHFTGTALLVAIGASVAAGGEVSGMRTMPSRTSARQRASGRDAHPAPTRPFRNLDQHFWNMSARLVRSGMDSSSLNTPPPQIPTDPAA